jgi:hypothetical protein
MARGHWIHGKRLRARLLPAFALCIGCAASGAAWAQPPASTGIGVQARSAGSHAPLAPISQAPSPDRPPSAADAQAARWCRNVHFVGYSTLEPGGQRVEESITWDDRSKSYLVRGPILSQMFNDPGVSRIPDDASVTQTLFRIAIRADYSNPIERFCEYNFQEMANCDVDGSITYTQLFTDCDLQTLQHVVRITPDQAGSVQLIDIRFQDVRGVFSNPLDLSEGTDLRLRVR